MATTTKKTTKTESTAKTTAKASAKTTATKKATKPASEGITLIIAEKPSVAADLVKVLGAKSFKKNNGYYESETTIVGDANGQRVTIAEQTDRDETTQP